MLLHTRRDVNKITKCHNVPAATFRPMLYLCRTLIGNVSSHQVVDPPLPVPPPRAAAAEGRPADASDKCSHDTLLGVLTERTDPVFQERSC